MHKIAAPTFSDLLTPKSRGETVNVHVVESVSEPQPDFAAMKRLIESGTVAGVPNNQRKNWKGNKPTPERVAIAFRQSAGIITEAAKKLGCHRSTLWRMRNEFPELKQVLADVKEETIDLAESKLLELIIDKDPGSIRYFLRCFGKERGYNETFRLAGHDGGAVQVNISGADKDVL
jgi:Bacterial regulatory protein, Fis family